ncbi:hypothetical protein HCG49_04005 [Arenibacter sp. 6A1]|uniref:chitobiase/beta-hexosaminidase C-terminal domain-containing protein n=1 Tax=Arenibacter sp. 6A1 TaxID=2720391 RepID=UPI00144652CA|nr:chitobiase/beta-hexosaminidase C-terminal domain-containing protein [Arenibacter sp. 6A1]NKI25720.1 hypothetical protein [Arenibacter sp. 6A1]
MKLIVAYLFVCLLFACQDSPKTNNFASTETFQLASPILEVDSALFKNSATVALLFNVPNTVLRYTTDGKEVSMDSEVYKKPITVKKSALIKAKAFHIDYWPSDESVIQIAKIKNNISHAAIKVSPSPHPNYSGMGPESLIDMQKGSIQFRKGDKWLGFQSDIITIDLKLDKEIPASKVYISTLIDQMSWIFSPDYISIYANNKQIGSKYLKDSETQIGQKLQYIEVPVTESNYNQLRILVHSLEKIPSWHQATGMQPWIFIDEILIE